MSQMNDSKVEIRLNYVLNGEFTRVKTTVLKDELYTEEELELYKAVYTFIRKSEDKLYVELTTQWKNVALVDFITKNYTPPNEEVLKYGVRIYRNGALEYWMDFKSGWWMYVTPLYFGINSPEEKHED